MAKTTKPRVKKVKTIETPIVEAPVAEAPVPVVPQEESAEKKAFRALIEDYKVKNPEKYAQKEAELLNQLNKL